MVDSKKPDLLAYFVSDIHLKSMEGELATKFLHFIQKIKNESKTTHLFLLGDIFDLWIGKKNVFIQKYKPLIEALKGLRDSGVEIHYFEGNHDLYLRDFWERELQFFVHEKPIYLNLNSTKFRLEHGDTIDKKDYSYLFLKWWLHTPLIKLLIRILPGKLIHAIGESLGKKSRLLSTKKNFPLEKLRKKVKRLIQTSIQKRDFNFFIAGHYHIRDDFIFYSDQKKVRVLNLGTWLNQACAFRWTKKKQEFIEL